MSEARTDLPPTVGPRSSRATMREGAGEARQRLAGGCGRAEGRGEGERQGTVETAKKMIGGGRSRVGGGGAYNYGRFRLGTYRRLDRFPGPGFGERAPDFSAETLDGRRVRLSDYRGRPVVLETGSYSCPMYVGKIGAMNELARRHPEAAFLVLYVREAHPGAGVRPHRCIEDKRALARRASEEDSEGREILVDDLDGTAHLAYGGMPEMVYVLDGEGDVVLRGEWNEPPIVGEALGRLRRGESSRGLRTGFDRVPPLVMLRVLRRAGWDALYDFLVEVPRILAVHLREALGRAGYGSSSADRNDHG